VAISRKAEKHETEKQYPASRDALASFAPVSFTEWGYFGQITAITMSTRFGQPFLVWNAAVRAMVPSVCLHPLAQGSAGGYSSIFH
jgi:putative Ca2+/H+ antiporter (TMEM165/GDT1 family)